MEIKIKSAEYIRILQEEMKKIEEYTGKKISKVSTLEYQNYLIDKHPDKIEVIKNE